MDFAGFTTFLFHQLSTAAPAGVHADMHLVDDLEFDSVELLMAFIVVGELGVEIPETAAMRVHTLGQLHDAYLQGFRAR